MIIDYEKAALTEKLIKEFHLILKSEISDFRKDISCRCHEQAQSRLQLIIKQMQEAESVNEKLKAYDWMAWVQL